MAMRGGARGGAVGQGRREGSRALCNSPTLPATEKLSATAAAVADFLHGFTTAFLSRVGAYVGTYSNDTTHRLLIAIGLP